MIAKKKKAQAKSTAEMIAKKKKAQAKLTAEMIAKKEKAQAKLTAEMIAKKKEAQAKSITEMIAKKKKAAQAELIAEMEAKKNKAAQAESNVEMENKEHAAAETTVLRDEAAAEPANDAEATAKSTAEMKAEKKKAQAKSISEMKAKKKEAQDKSTAEMKAKKKKAEPTVKESCSHMKFCIGPDHKSASKALIALREIGLEVHDVWGDGNCGCCCLLVGLAVLGFPKQANQKALRKHLQGKAEHCRTAFRKLPMHEPLDDEGFEEEHGKSADLLHSKELTHTRKFMETKDKKSKYENGHHWMELTFVVSLFCCDCRLRVVVYYSNGDTWSTCIFDGRDVGANDSVQLMGCVSSFLMAWCPSQVVRDHSDCITMANTMNV
jgi:hypothetical protein